MLSASCVAALIALTFAINAQARELPESGTIERRVLSLGDQKRVYWLYRPIKEVINFPLIIALHSEASSARRLMETSGLNTHAQKQGFIVAYPEGTGWLRHLKRSWNAGYCCGLAQAKGVNDITFLDKLIDALIEKREVDVRKIYITGASNGGMMAYRYACERTDRITAIAVVAGAMRPDDCRPNKTLPVMAFHGTRDTYVPYLGGRGTSHRATRVDPGVPEVMNFWARHNGCESLPRASREGLIEQYHYNDCVEGTAVELVTIHGFGHAWPPFASEYMLKFFFNQKKR